MRVGDLSPRDLARKLERPGLSLETGPFVIRLQASVPAIAEAIGSLYCDFPVADGDALVDFQVRAECRPGLLRRWRREVRFFFDDEPLFEPMPLELAVPTLEWNLNWIASTNTYQYVFLHSAVVERGGLAAVMPGTSGSGKSTLCAALVHRGWRHLSDEFGLLRPHDALLAPWPRPLSLKAASIDRIRAFAPQALIGPVSVETDKGPVAQMRPPAESVRRRMEPAAPRWIVFPRYEARASTRWSPVTRSRALMRLADNSMNAENLGLLAFESLVRVIETTDAFDLVYSELEEALELFESLASATPAGAVS